MLLRFPSCWSKKKEGSNLGGGEKRKEEGERRPPVATPCPCEEKGPAALPFTNSQGCAAGCTWAYSGPSARPLRVAASEDALWTSCFESYHVFVSPRAPILVSLDHEDVSWACLSAPAHVHVYTSCWVSPTSLTRVCSVALEASMTLPIFFDEMSTLPVGYVQVEVIQAPTRTKHEHFLTSGDQSEPAKNGATAPKGSSS